MLKTGSLLLSSCWKHYGMLMRLEDHKFSLQHKELLDQYLSGIQVAVLHLDIVFTLLMLRETRHEICDSANSLSADGFGRKCVLNF